MYNRTVSFINRYTLFVTTYIDLYPAATNDEYKYPPNPMTIRFQITVKGFNIHHCGFRTYAYELGRSLNLSGMVAYTEHDLLIEVEGSASNVNQFIEWIRLGPVDSDINEFNLKEIPSSGGRTFHVIDGYLFEAHHRNVIYA